MADYNKEALDKKLREGAPKHPWRNRFHLEMPWGFTGSVKGILAKGGVWHLFLQWNPFSTRDENKSWVHLETRDFLHYNAPTLALWPSGDIDREGCGSGSVYQEGHEILALYTGRRTEGKTRANLQIAARLAEDGVFHKEGVAIEKPPEGYTDLFQGPYVFRMGNATYVLLGAQRAPKEDARGCALLYRQEGKQFQFLGELRTDLGFFGRVWECPSLLTLGGKTALVFSPRGLEGQKYAYQNLFQSGYVAGRLTLPSGEFLHGPFRELDKGFDFFAPHSVTHEGRNIVIGWMAMPHRDMDYPTEDLGFMHALTMPRTLTLRQGRIYTEPIKEMKDLRVQESQREIHEEQTKNVTAPLYKGTELVLAVRFGKAPHLTMTFHYGEEELSLFYDRAAQIMTINREGMHLGAKGTRRFRLYADGELYLRAYLDKTAVEFFFQHGEEAASLLVFPEKNEPPTLTIAADQELDEVNATFWDLAGIRFEGAEQ